MLKSEMDYMVSYNYALLKFELTWIDFAEELFS